MTYKIVVAKSSKYVAKDVVATKSTFALAYLTTGEFKVISNNTIVTIVDIKTEGEPIEEFAKLYPEYSI